MQTPIVNTLEVPGAALYHERRGTGPLLLLVPGGNGDAGPYQRVAEALEARYTVVSYDRRGFSRSPSHAGPPSDPLATDADDARRLIEHVGAGQAIVFGSSSGGIVALELCARYPDQVRTAIAHEPPLLTLLPDATEALAFMDSVYETYRETGVDAAMRVFSEKMGFAVRRLPEGGDLPPPIREMLTRMRQNHAHWLEHELRQYTRAAVDMGTLASLGPRVVLAVGEDSRGSMPYRPNLILAERLGQPVYDFPGGHLGYMTDPVAFSVRLNEVLDGLPRFPRA